MKTSDIIKSRDAAKAFVKHCDAVLAEREKYYIEHDNKNDGRHLPGTKLSGGLNRLSMSLTRLLANMRNPK